LTGKKLKKLNFRYLISKINCKKPGKRTAITEVIAAPNNRNLGIIT
jgi:hypothetical protein